MLMSVIGQPQRQPEQNAGFFLLVAILGCVIAIAGELLTSLPALLAGVALIIGGSALMGFLVYRFSRDSGISVTKSFARTTRLAVEMILDMLP
jgi:hypothetical protein